MSTACLDVVDKVPAEEAEGRKPHVTPGISAEEHHRYLVALFRANNRVRREFIEVLLSLWEQKLYLKLGSPSIVEYAGRHFGLKASQSYECLRVAKALRELTLISSAFDRGEINWTVVKRITQVASERTQERWLEFCKGRTTRQIEAEVKEAQRKNRDRPRKEGDSMPTLRLRVSFELAPEEHDLVEKALGKVTSELGEKLGGGRLDPKDALLFMARRMLETDPAQTPEGRREKEESLYTILYHSCPSCRKASVRTVDGPVEIDRAIVERVEEEAEKVHIGPQEELDPDAAEASDVEEPATGLDKPNTATLRKKVVLRDGKVCANPNCGGRVALHCHHIKYRACGGKTVLVNEICLCSLCHALVHDGRLRIEGNPIDGLRWITAAEAIAAPLEEDLKFLSELGLEGKFTLRAHEERDESTRVDFLDEASPRTASLLRALRSLGYSKADATQRLRQAYRRLFEALRRAPSEEELLREALKTR